MSVSIVEVTRILKRSAMEADPGVEDDRRRERERNPLPAREAQRGHHGKQRDGDGERDGELQPAGEHAQRLVVMVVPATLTVRCGRASGAVAGRLDRLNEILHRHLCVAVHRCLLGREVDRRLDAVEAIQPLLDAHSAGGAGHPFEVEPELGLLLRLRRRGHCYAAS
jgi:hypothetical protein